MPTLTVPAHPVAPTVRPHPLVTLARDFRDGLVSLRLTAVLLIFSMVLVFAGTLEQVDYGIWAVQEKYFRSFVVYMQMGQAALPFPGGYTIGGLLLINLLAAHVYRFRFAWKKTGILLTHAGLIVLLLGELFTGVWQKDFFLTLDQGQTRNYAESHLHYELALIDASDPAFDDVVVIPEALLARKAPVAHPKLPFEVRATTYYPNSTLRIRGHGDAPSGTTPGLGDQVAASPLPVTYKQKERNVPTAYVEVTTAGASLGTFLVSPHLAAAQDFAHAGRTWRILLRPQRAYLPTAFTLLQFSHDRYAGTEIPKNFSSRVRLTSPDGRDTREALIWMNNPLREGGFTFYQAGFENNDRTTILQVVRNPSWLMPYIACGLVTLGLVVQFGIHLGGFVSKRSRSPLREGGAMEGRPPARPRPAQRPALQGSARRYLPALTGGLALLFVAAAFRGPRNTTAFDTVAFGRVPVLLNGRFKPMDTVARTSLLMMQGRQRVAGADGRTVSPEEWLLDVLFRHDKANTYQTFEIVHPDVLALLHLSPEKGAGGKRFSFDQMRGSLASLEAQAKLADDVEPAVRTPFHRAVVQLRNSLVLYQRLQSSLAALGVPGFFGELAKVEGSLAPLAGPAAGAHGSPEDKRMLELARSFATMDQYSYFHAVPPVAGGTGHDWKTFGSAWSDALATGKVNPAARALAHIGRAWLAGDAAGFNEAVAALHAAIDGARPELAVKARAETRFNTAQPFYTSSVLFVAAFLLAVFSWLRWPAALSRAAFALLLIAFALTTIGIGTRMWLEGRPPVTNLYSSALFVGWGAVALCVLLEKFYRNSIGSVAGSAIGFATLLIAHHLALGGDTMEMMRAVLDSNFWLATHVVTIAIGYSATFLAGFLAIIYVLRGLLTRSLDEATGAALGRMIYGIVCFATLFSFVGTILGGIWADQSWGRFWGWDPKENGALLIVIWNALLLHVRWAGLVKTRGLACLAIFGNIVTAWSWFGVNMLGVGLHSYGFMDAAFWWLVGFAVSQLLIIALAGLPLSKWRSAPSLLRVATP